MRTRLYVHDLENFHCRLLLPKSCTACPQAPPPWGGVEQIHGKSTRFRVMRYTVMRRRISQFVGKCSSTSFANINYICEPFTSGSEEKENLRR
ncbi:Uncharacterized protein APZ42_003791 [Daphnia magna]|uniref:Uncharacterized protein n=1 Tax=Daphnia magna TaxID=35525 RepID=A0A164HF59_9CRUS|nr:Uncharacterized protein APZ42_003791 [Daphnia magna]